MKRNIRKVLVKTIIYSIESFIFTSYQQNYVILTFFTDWSFVPSP